MTATSITSKDLNTALESNDIITIIDVRKKPAFDASPETLPQATWQIFDQVEQWSVNLSSEIKANKVVVYCVHGHEVSQNAAIALTKLGFNASYLEGGIASWVEQGYLLSE